MRIGPENGEFATKGNDLAECGGAVCVGDVTFLRSIHDIAATPKIVEGIVHADLAYTVLVCEFHAAFHGSEGHALPKLQLSVPHFTGSEFLFDDFDLSARFASTGGAAEKVVEVEGLDGIVRANAMRRGHFAEPRSVLSFIGGVTTMNVGGADKVVMSGGRDDVVRSGHGGVNLV